MEKNTLLADLRNKLSPVKNYISMQRELEQLRATVSTSNLESYNNHMKLLDMVELIQKEQIVAEQSWAKAELIIELLEKI